MTSDPDQIRGDIERTQANLSADVNALTEKVSPPRIVERRVQRTRSAVTGLKDKIMGSATDTGASWAQAAGSSAGSVTGSLADAKDTLADKASATADAAGSAVGQVRQRAQGNPLAAGLIAFGAGWLLSSLLPASEPEQQAAGQVKDLAVEKGRPIVQQAGQEAAAELRDSAQQHVQAVKDTAADAARTVQDEARSQASDVADHTQQARDRVTGQSGF